MSKAVGPTPGRQIVWPEIDLDAWLDEPTPPPRMPRRKLYRADLKEDSAGPFAGLDPSELADEVPPDVDEHGHLV